MKPHQKDHGVKGRRSSSPSARTPRRIPWCCTEVEKPDLLFDLRPTGTEKRPPDRGVAGTPRPQGASVRGNDTSLWRIAMNTDQFKGKWVQFKGSQKQWGKINR